ncbi:MAG: TRAP transporter large permease [Gammaproteobacteria bacterium]|nr:TRAP transporter large permease [Gammaproteobacteria bacterium]MBU1443396.1 TRAP transporter large permease [Gammaproteobacteria bacterium]MBU2286570.1 TRAP transporter large permease [Gammaproteobacteria bacterium]
MFNATDMVVLVTVLLGLVFCGFHIAVSLGVTSLLGIYLVNGDIETVKSFTASTAYEALRDYIFAVIPLFMLMGEFLAKCGAARDLFTLVDRLSRRVPGRLGVATVLANAVFAFVTGVSIAAAAAFSKIAHPEMRRFGYERKFSLGCIAGSACLGMLIPPSVLMIVWGVLTELAIGRLFIAGIVPGLLVVLLYIGYIVWVAKTRPERVGEGDHLPRIQQEARLANEQHAVADLRTILWSTLGILCLVVLVLGGIWLGFFTPTEGAGVGATLALALALARGMRGKEVLEAVLSVGRTSAPLLLLLVTAQLYSRILAMTGITGAAKEFFVHAGLSPFVVLALMVAVWFVLGCIIDSISIILLTVPVFAPVAVALGFDPIAFAVLGIIAIETGLLTPPFGILVFTVKAAVAGEPDLSTGEIFRGAAPYWMALLAAIVLIAVFPQIATWLPDLANSLRR